MKGIILAGGSGTRLYPITKGVSKQLLPIYDKPMIYYPLSTLMLAKIKDILIITTREDQASFKKLLGDGSQFGINLSYVIQEKPNGLAESFILGEEFIGDDTCAMILGDNIYFGNDFVKTLNMAREISDDGYATVFGYQVKDPERFGVMELDNNNRVISIEEKPKVPKSCFAVTGLYFYPKGVAEYAKRVKPSSRGELEITTLNNMYLYEKKLKAELLGGGYLWYDTGVVDSLNDASNMIKNIQNNNNRLICSPETIALKNGWISIEKYMENIEGLKNDYGKLLLKEMDDYKKTRERKK